MDVLTPSHVLQLHVPNELISASIDLRDRYKKYWKQAQLLADMFWRRWRNEYLPLLQARNKWSRTRRDVTVGDLVLLVDGNQPRGLWKKGVVVSVAKGDDGHVREVELKTVSGLQRRDIRKICLLEGADEE